MLRAASRAQINRTLVANLGRTVCSRTVFSVVPIAILANVLQVIWRKASRQTIFPIMLGGSH